MRSLLALAVAMCAIGILDRATAGSGNHTTQEERKCAVEGFVIETNPKGLNVRKSPTGRAKILGTLPTKDAQTFVHIAAAKRGWFLIDDVQVIALSGKEPKAAPKHGWVHGRMLGTMIHANAHGRRGGGLHLYERPEVRSTILHTVEAVVSVVRLLDCAGEWSKVEVFYADGTMASGWLHPYDQCGSSSCP